MSGIKRGMFMKIEFIEGAGPNQRNQRRLDAPETLTGLLSQKPLDVDLRRLQRAELRKRKAKR